MHQDIDKERTDEYDEQGWNIPAFYLQLFYKVVLSYIRVFFINRNIIKDRSIGFSHILDLVFIRL